MPRPGGMSNIVCGSAAAAAQQAGGSIAAMRGLGHAGGSAARAPGPAAVIGRGARGRAAGFAVVAWMGLTLPGCGGGAPPAPAAAAAVKRFPAPIFDGLSLGMTRAEATRVRGMRPSLTAGGKNLRIWVYETGDYTVHLTFGGRAESDRLARIDVHYGREAGGIGPFLARLEERYGAPDVRRRQAVINSYGDRAHEQYETIWSDAD